MICSLPGLPVIVVSAPSEAADVAAAAPGAQASSAKTARPMAACGVRLEGVCLIPLPRQPVSPRKPAALENLSRVSGDGAGFEKGSFARKMRPQWG